MSSVGRVGRLSLALAAALALVAASADARVGGGGSFGSRGTRTYTAPPTTRTAPAPAAPVDRSITRPNAAPVQPTTSPGGPRFGTGFGGLLLGGFLGAGLFGLLSGFGLLGGITGLTSLLGLLLQLALIAWVARLAIGYFRSRQQPLPARASVGMGADGDRSGSLGGTLGGAGGPARAAAPLLIGSADYDAFERLLGEIQTAYSREDVRALGGMTTPEMLSYFSQDLADNRRKGVRNEVADVKLLQGDLAESWHEADTDYATVAIRFSLRDAMIERGTGRVLSGDATAPQQVAEVWTFQRDHREPAQGWQQGWHLSAIQQAA
jgi:predicted lipid-binding transport protein (Tim44 family)